MTIKFNTKPKVGDVFFMHRTADAFQDPTSDAAHIDRLDCEESARAWAGDDWRGYLVIECRVVRRFPGKQPKPF